MALADFTTALSAEGWTQDEIDQLHAMFDECLMIAQVHKWAKTIFSQALSRWNADMSAKVATLPAAFEIPSPFNMQGVQPVTKENLTNNIMAYITTVQALGSQAHLDNILPLVGSKNLQ